jgi:hypothetical protein
MVETIRKSYQDLSTKYDKTYIAYDEKTNAFINFSDKVDFVCFANPYDNMTHKLYASRFC